MKTKILDALKAKFEGVSDAILGRMADKLAKTATSTTDVTTLIEGVTFNTLLESYGDSRATEAQVTAVRNYESKHGLKDGKVVEQVKPDPDPVTPAWAQSLIEQIAQVSTRITAIEGEKTHNLRKQQFDAAIEKLPEALRKPYARIAYKDLSEEEFATMLSEVGSEVEELVKETGGAPFGAPKGRAAGGSNKSATEEELDAVVSRM